MKSELDKFQIHYEMLPGDPFPHIRELNKLAFQTLVMRARFKLAIRHLTQKLKK